MSHHLYQTEAIVLADTSLAEDSRFVRLFTKDLGMVSARAQGVRKITSKLRYSLQELSLVRVTLVRGKEVWRITGAEEIESFYRVFAHDKRRLHVCAQAGRLTDRLMQGEGANEKLFSDLSAAFMFLRYEPLLEEEIRTFETLIVTRILHRLGYWGRDGAADAFLFLPYSTKLLEELAPIRRKLNAEINAALHATQL